MENKRTTPGTGYIIVPSNVSRDKYVETCYRRERVSILIEGGGGVIHDCYITRQALREAYFPIAFKDQDKVLLGSAVVFIMSDHSDIPIIIGVFSNTGEALDVKEHSFSFKRDFDGNIVSISGNAKHGNININVTGNKGKGKLNIYVNNVDRDAQMNLMVGGNVNIDVDETLSIRPNKLQIGDEKKVEPFVLGNKNTDVLNEIKDILDQLKSFLSTFAKAQEEVSTTASLAPLKPGYITLLSNVTGLTVKISKVETDIKKILSNISFTE